MDGVSTGTMSVPARTSTAAFLHQMIPYPAGGSGVVEIESLDLVHFGAVALRYTGLVFSTPIPILTMANNGPSGTGNHPPEPVGAIPAQTLTAGHGEVSVSAAEYFRDPDGDRLTYVAASSDAGAVTVQVSGDSIQLTPVAAGMATVTITARDPAGLAAQQTMGVSVNPPVGSPATDRQALEALYDAAGGPGWTIGTNWKTAAPLDQWYGVSTEGDSRVSKLELFNNTLRGTIPAELGNLTNLQRLILDQNALSGTIPTELGNLTNLEQLVLYGNGLSGTIPAWLGNLTNLQVLSLSNNALRGTIPAELGRLTNLQRLILNENQLSGTLPSSLTNLRQLRVFFFNSNAGLCAPATPALQTWMRVLEQVSGPTCGP